MNGNDDIQILSNGIGEARAKSHEEVEPAQLIKALAEEEARLAELLKEEKSIIMGGSRLVFKTEESRRYLMPGLLNSFCKVNIFEELDYAFPPQAEVQMSIFWKKNQSDKLFKSIKFVASAMGVMDYVISGEDYNKICFYSFFVRLEFSKPHKEAASKSMQVFPVEIQNLVFGFAGERVPELNDICNALMATCKLIFDPRLLGLEHADRNELRSVKFVGAEEAAELFKQDIFSELESIYESYDSDQSQRTFYP